MEGWEGNPEDVTSRPVVHGGPRGRAHRCPGRPRRRPAPAAQAPSAASRSALRLGALLAPLLLPLLPRAGLAHETWLLSPERMAELNGQPPPELFVHLTPTNALMLALAAVGVVGWVLVANSGRESRLGRALGQLAGFERDAPVVVR